MPPVVSGPCPNPKCSSRTPVFANLNKHLSQEPECMTFYQALQKDFHLNLSMVVNDNKTPCKSDASTDATITNIDGYCPVRNACLLNAELQDEPQDNTFIQNEDDADLHFAFNENIESHMDYDYTNFAHLQSADDLDRLSNPCQAVFTSARRIETTLLQILTELEAPLWAFKDSMEWACDAYPMGYNFMPQQSSYKAQLQTLGWHGAYAPYRCGRTAS
jgi:hypothetical protein